MLTLAQIKENPERIIERLAVKGFEGAEHIHRVIELDDQRRALQLSSDTKAAELKKLSGEIGALMKKGLKSEAEQAKLQVAALKETQKAEADKLTRTEKEIQEILLNVPNVPCDMVPQGRTADDNVVEKTGGPMPELGSMPATWAKKCPSLATTHCPTGNWPRNTTLSTSTLV